MQKAEILMTAPMQSSVEEALDASFTVHRLWQQDDEAAYLRDIGPRIRGVATSSRYGQLEAALMDQLPNLEIISSFGVGYDHVDAVAAAEHGVVVTNTPGVLDDEVADLTIGLLLATLRQLPQADRFLREGRWLNGTLPLSSTLRDRRVGIVGFGRIGKAIAQRLAGFNVAISYYGRNRQDAVSYDYHPTLHDLAEASDVLIVTVPGGDTTRHLIDGEVLKALGSNGVLINVARGTVVDEQALIDALQSGTILSAGLDVFEDEPRVPQELIDIPQVVLLPHIGSASVHTRNAMGKLLVDNLEAWFSAGKPLTSVSETAHLVTSA